MRPHSFRKVSMLEIQEHRMDKKLDETISNALKSDNPYSLDEEKKISDPPHKQPLHREPLYIAPTFPSTIYLKNEQELNRNKPVYGYEFRFDKIDEFFELEEPIKIVKKRAQSAVFKGENTFITEANVEYEEQPMEEVVEKAKDIYNKTIRTLKKQAKYNSETEKIEAETLQIRKEYDNDNEEMLVQEKSQEEREKEKETSVSHMVNEKQLELESLELVNKLLEEQLETIHQRLFIKQQEIQQYNDLVPLLTAIEEKFPDENPFDVISKISELEERSCEEINMADNMHVEIKESESERENIELTSTEEKYELEKSGKEKITTLEKQVDELDELNIDKNQDVQKACEIQSEYLQLCENITAFYIKYGRLFGGNLPDFIVPSVNSPLEVLRAMDTMFSVAFPETSKAEENIVKINGCATHVWQKLLAIGTNNNLKQCDTLEMLEKSKYLVSCSEAEEKELDNMKQRLIIEKETLQEELNTKWENIQMIIEEIRKFGENSEFRWDLAIFNDSEELRKRKQIEAIEKDKTESKKENGFYE